MACTRTGSFPIGLRHLRKRWQADIGETAQWMKQNGFEVIDVDAVDPKAIEAATRQGIRIGSVDLKDWKQLLSPDKGARRAAIDENIAHIRASTAAGGKIFFALLLPQDTERSRRENFDLAAHSYGELADAARDVGGRIAIEGWPGPRNAAQGCNPETYRELIKIAPGVIGVNYDPSHLVRMFIDPVRFLHEFAPHVWHVHAKDTQIYPEMLYEVGVSQAPTFAPVHKWGEAYWRYTLPGHGNAPWKQIVDVLAQANYGGALSIELEDENFNGTDDGEQRGFLASRDFLINL